MNKSPKDLNKALHEQSKAVDDLGEASERFLYYFLEETLLRAVKEASNLYLCGVHTTLSLKWGGGLYSNIRLVSTIHPQKHMDAVKSHGDFAVTIQRKSSNIGHAPQVFSQICWYFLQKSASKITHALLVVTGD